MSEHDENCTCDFCANLKTDYSDELFVIGYHCLDGGEVINGFTIPTDDESADTPHVASDAA